MLQSFAKPVKQPSTLLKAPAELLIRILKYLTASELFVVSEVCKGLNEVCREESLWKDLCAEEWADKKHLPLKLFPYYDYASSSAILERLSREDCLSILDGRGLNGLATDLNGLETDLNALLRESRLDFYYYGPCSSKWKASLVAARLDATRNIIQLNELIGLQWEYHDGWAVSSEARVCPVVRFHPNGIRGPVSGIRPKPCGWNIQAETIQVADYPPHSVERVPDGGWELFNGWVRYLSI